MDQANRFKPSTSQLLAPCFDNQISWAKTAKFLGIDKVDSTSGTALNFGPGRAFWIYNRRNYVVLISLNVRGIRASSQIRWWHPRYFLNSLPYSSLRDWHAFYVNLVYRDRSPSVAITDFFWKKYECMEVWRCQSNAPYYHPSVIPRTQREVLQVTVLQPQPRKAQNYEAVKRKGQIYNKRW